jgi:hypothetical protein
MPDDDIDLERRAVFARDLEHHLYHALADWMAVNESKGVKPGEVLVGMALFAGTGLTFLALGANLPDPILSTWTGEFETIVRTTLTKALAEARRRQAAQKEPS